MPIGHSEGRVLRRSKGNIERRDLLLLWSSGQAATRALSSLALFDRLLDLLKGLSATADRRDFLGCVLDSEVGDRLVGLLVDAWVGLDALDVKGVV